eukprot:5109020-Pyramimonas_sp.AAC.1
MPTAPGTAPGTPTAPGTAPGKRAAAAPGTTLDPPAAMPAAASGEWEDAQGEVAGGERVGTFPSP